MTGGRSERVDVSSPNSKSRMKLRRDGSGMGTGAAGSGTGDREPEPTRESIRSEFLGRDLPRHLALFYDSIETQLAVCAAFVRWGFDDGRRVLYLYDENEPDEIEAALRAADVDVERRTADGDLRIADAGSVYLDEEFDPDRLIECLEREAHDAVEAGYTGLAVAGENTWCFHTSFSFDHILEFECDFDACVPDLPVRALCQYSLDRFDGESIGKALWTHEYVVYRGRICENPFYVSPEEFRGSVTDQSGAELMLEQTYSLAQARREIRRRRQRIEVLNRTLRHDVRNEVNVILGHLDGALDDDRLDGQDRERIEVARRYAERIAHTSEKARYAEETLSEERSGEVDLARLVDRAAETLSDRRPDAEITTSIDGSWTVIADRHLLRAVEELLENAIGHQDRAPPEVTVSVRRRGDSVEIEVANPGEPIPEDDQRALRRGRETPLSHGHGIGLWMVKWITENSNGSLRFPRADGECRVRIELPSSAIV
ncbi:GHKL domain-containing protein [Halobellus limi]|uniref:histidine kinase n=2 Tax=Halobellus limi TaxID=699433 RepID=A0A4D6H118_9EURY|nr:GHKL domain-containing protein [Halobellus limi]